PLAAEWRLLSGQIRHTFTHFHLDLAVAVGRAGPKSAARGIWCSLDRLEDQALPTVMRKVVRHALAKAY
ncbi:MAG TPA: NUDIX domain-containing protein, partial [Rhodospirillaceae bacterium]|nr:NUDIX domain-containing protein [Rhodospirillaceae bacterium]